MRQVTISPLARAIRLGDEIRRRREAAGISQAELARRAGVARTVLSRIETPTGEPARRADPRFVRAVLAELGALDDLEELMWESTSHGWWDGQRRMGAGQQIVASIEHGAARIRAYQMTLVPGIVQTADYARCRAVAGGEPDPDAVVAGRLRRQQQLVDAQTQLDIVIEDLALRRLVAPPAVMAEQLYHLASLAERPGISVRVLPPDARLTAGSAPTAPFSIYEYPDPTDPVIVVLDVVGQPPVPIVEPDRTTVYVQLHERLERAALSPEDSAALIKAAADQMAGR